MGVGTNVLEFFNRSIANTIGSIAGKRMAELGDQKLHADIALKEDGSRVWFKDWIEARACHHYSIDLHGRNGSYPLDLGVHILDPFWHNNFDIVTNFGTSEHVFPQDACWFNMHRLGKQGCIYIHVVPEFGMYNPEHSKYFYDNEFFSMLIKANGYTPILNESIRLLGHVGACYIKPARSKFVFDDEWLRRAG